MLTVKSLTKVISRYVSTLLIIPAILLTLIVCFDIYLSTTNMSIASISKQNSNLSASVLNLVHELQKERGLTAGFIGSKGAQFKQQLQQQRNITDVEFNKVTQQLNESDYVDQVAQAGNAVVNELRQLSNMRNTINSLSTQLPDAIGYYSNVNKLGLAVVKASINNSENHLIAEELNAIYNLSSAKEYAGIERAVLNTVIINNAFTTATLLKHSLLTEKQTLYIEESLSIAPKKLQPILQQFVQNADNKKVIQTRAELIAQQENFDISANEWFAMATKRIDAIKVAEQQAFKEVLSTAKKISDNALTIVIIEVILLVVGVMLSLALFIAVKMSKEQSLEISAAIKHITVNRDLTRVVQQISYDNLGNTSLRINELVDNLKHDFNLFSNLSTTIVTSALQTAKSIEESRASLEDQQQNIHTITSATEQMNVNVNVIANSMKENTNLVASVVEESMQGKKIVANAANTINSAAADMNNTSELIDDLNNKVGNITSMVEMIRSIAEQTNLLALNAAIEAARAGEQGRGFAVVADEVRNLAQRTQNSTKEIADVVTELQVSADNAHKKIEDGTINAKLATERAAEIEATLNNIVKQIEVVKEVTDTVSTNTNEQSLAIQEVTTNIVNIYDKANDNVTSAQQIYQATVNIEESAESMEKSIKQYKVK